MTDPIKLEGLRELVAAGTVKVATIIGQQGGYVVAAPVGKRPRTLVNKQGAVKMFATTETAVRELRRLGLQSFKVETADYVPGLIRSPRHDVTQRAKEASQALEFDRWVREQVDEALEDESNGTATWHAHDDVWAELLKKTAAQVAKREQVGTAVGQKIAAIKKKVTSSASLQRKNPMRHVAKAASPKKGG